MAQTQLYNTLFNHPFFATRFNIPESFGRCLSYEAQIHCLLCLIDEIVGAAWVSPEELNAQVERLERLIAALQKLVEQYHTELTNLINQEAADRKAADDALGDRITNLDQKVENYHTELGNQITQLGNKVDQYYQDLGQRITNVAGDVSNLTNAFNEYKNSSGTDITNLTNSRNTLVADIYGATVDASGNVSLPSGTKVPVADLNLWSDNASPSDGAYGNAIRSRGVSNGDIKGV